MDIWKCVSLWILLHICPDINACPANSTSKYARVGETVRLQFQVDVNFKQFVVYDILMSNQVKVLGIAYFNGANFTSLYLDNSLNFVGNLTTGNLSVEISKVKLQNGNVYSMNRDTESISCISLYVLDGPDRCNINVQSPYILAEGNTPATITCQSDCFPSCSYKWTNSSTGKVVGFEGEFQLDTLTRYEAGNYTCSCQNTAIIDHRDTTSLQVIVNFASFFITKARQKLLSVRMKLMYTLSVKLTAMQDQKSK
ncbi:uncharacterized protein LOC123534418 isoform X3 [Mercenaria mercenaria]|uniref:uncharacterized protein LOC123534418 isoform X3 n=1 Tax=Mercenaria mercenaria TaxID=6596 RepID=UPI00234FB040|nr:uncharacterized protein LOC123534418 isoform X3 [Mercenaria mercenaria]